MATEGSMDWAKASAPTEEHKFLEEKLQGKWTYEVRFCMDSSGEFSPPNKGELEYVSSMGGRFVEGKHTSICFGVPFEGHDIMGFDKMRKEFICFWRDNFGTGWITTKGSLSEDKKVLKMSGIQDDPCSGVLNQEMRTELHFVDDNKHQFSMFVLKDGEWHCNMKLESVRA